MLNSTTSDSFRCLFTCLQPVFSYICVDTYLVEFLRVPSQISRIYLLCTPLVSTLLSYNCSSLDIPGYSMQYPQLVESARLVWLYHLWVILETLPMHWVDRAQYFVSHPLKLTLPYCFKFSVLKIAGCIFFPIFGCLKWEGKYGPFYFILTRNRSFPPKEFLKGIFLILKKEWWNNSVFDQNEVVSFSGYKILSWHPFLIAC